MDRKRIMRLLCALVCAALLISDAPANLMRASADIAEPAEMQQIEEAAAAEESAEEAPASPDAEQVDEAAQLDEAAQDAPEPEAEPDSGESGAEEEPGIELDALTSGWVADMDALGVRGDYARALWLYDRVIANFERGSADDALSAMMGLSGSPLGYALAYEALLGAAGIECRTVAEGEIAWNIAKLDGAWAHIDAYADDAPDRFGAHFGLSDAEMARDHDWSAELPACEGAANPSAEAEEEVPAEEEAEESESAAGAQPLVLEAAKSIVPSVSSLTLGNGETAVIQYTLLPAGAQDIVTYSAEPAGIVKGDQSGNIVAKKAGSCVVVLTTESGLRAEVPVTVKKAPGKIGITGDRKILGVGETEQLGYKLNPANAAGKVKFSIKTGSDIVSLSDDGLLTGLKPGKAKIIATTYNNKKASAVTIEVRPAPTSVAPPMEELRIGLGDSFALEWKLDEGSAGKLNFSSSNPAVASVDPDSGEISARALGSAVVTASAYGVASGEMPVTVVPGVTKLELGEAPVLGVKQTLQIEPLLHAGGALFDGNYCTLRYKSSKAAVASVNDTGLITAKKAGSATITVSAGDGIEDSYLISVKKAPSSVSIAADRRELGVGEALRLGYNLKPSDTLGTASFSVPENQDVASVTPDGLLTGLNPGSVKVTVETQNKKKKSLAFEVKPAPTAIEFVSVPERIGLGSKEKLSARLNEGSAGEIYFRAIDPATGEASDAVEIDAKGEITAKKLGSAAIEAYTYVEGLRASANLTVVPGPESLKLPESIDLGVDDTYQIAPVPLPEGSAASYSYASGKKSIATVSEDGLVKGKKTGSTSITVQANNGVEGKLNVNVKKKPSSVSLSAKELTLGVGEQAKLEATITKDSATTLSFSFEGEAIGVTPDAEDPLSALVEGEAEGEAILTATTHNKKKAKCAVTVVPAPTAIHFDESYQIAMGQEYFSPHYTLEPANAHTSLRYELVSGSGVEIEDGRIIATGEGQAIVRANTHVPGVSAEFAVTVVPAPESISLPENFAVELGSTAKLMPAFHPEDTSDDLTFEIKGKKGYFTIDEHSGEITPIKKTTAGIEVKVTTSQGKSASTKVWVVDDLAKPVILEFRGESPVSIRYYETYTPELYVFPEGADPQIRWESSDTDVAVISDSENGTVGAASVKEGKPLPSGRVTITGTSRSNSKLTVKYALIVLSEGRCLIMPDHRIDAADKADVDDVKEEIEAVRKSAYDELNMLVAEKWITQSERNKRQEYVDRAFGMYDFAWRPNAKKLYWKAANDEGGHKNFQPDTIYFGMPYTQSNRGHSNLNNYTVPSSDGYDYRVTTDSFSANRRYPGSDCSSYCSMAVWGYDSGRKSDNTNSIASAGYYTTYSHWDDLRPGDLICLGGHHVVMFLYYTKPSREQFVVIEQGGGGDDQYSNCVSTSIRDKTYYTKKGYKIRRPTTVDSGYVDRDKAK